MSKRKLKTRANLLTLVFRTPRRQFSGGFVFNQAKGTFMKTLILSLTILSTLALAMPAQAGNCDHSWDSASDGSRCGDRAADVRKGGKNGGFGY